MKSLSLPKLEKPHGTSLSLIFGSILIFGSTVAIAQPSTTQPTTPTEFTLRLKPNDVNVIGKALGKLPFDEVAEVINSLRAQIIDQSTPRPVEPKKE